MRHAEYSRDAINDRLRLILLLDACEAADIAPIPLMRIHALAFLANVLSPIWSVRSYDGKILKRRGGPFYPELQTELDRLVGLGFVTVCGVRHIQDEGRWRLDGSFALRSESAEAVIDVARAFQGERDTIDFLRRLAFAVSRLKEPLEDLVQFDATWSDKRTGVGDVIDFSEWRSANYTAFVAETFTKLGPLGSTIGRGDKLPLYMRYLERKSNG
ncbi:hypothetical protein [Bradyrhizobium oligotrophicum]|uniref:hypothetical protein n=1 Tax=Bradyrhizobium oligotrophicum TaxID=44255 RepID=UPI003EBD4BC5